LKYVYIVPLASVVAIALNTFDLYGDGELEWDHGYPYCALLVNCTQLVALYVLAWLYLVCKNELAPFRPMAKFLVVKAVVFMTFWQGVTISILVKIGWIQETENFTAGQLEMSMQDFLVCIEMFMAAAVHKYTFGFENYKDGSLLMLMEVRKELRAAKSRMIEAGFVGLEPGQTGDKIELDEHGHPKKPLVQQGAEAKHDDLKRDAVPSSKVGEAGVRAPLASWDNLATAESPEDALRAVGQGIVDLGKGARDVTMAGAKRVKDFTHHILKADDIF